MECGEVQKTLLQVLAESLYRDENGQVYLNTVRTGVDCETITPLITCENNHIDLNTLFVDVLGSDSCGNASLKLLYSLGGEVSTVRTVTESGNMLMSDEVIVCNSDVAIDFFLLAASGSGRERHIKNIGTGVVTVDAGLGTLDGQSSIELNQWESIHVIDYTDNTWLIL